MEVLCKTRTPVSLSYFHRNPQKKWTGHKPVPSKQEAVRLRNVQIFQIIKIYKISNYNQHVFFNTFD
jgi:hypothetical protein